MANPPPPKMPTQPKKPVASWRLKLGKAIPWLFGLFALGALVQVFFAGYGIENLGAQGMDYHVTFAHVIEVLPLLILIVGFVGADWRAGVGGIVLLVQFQLQYVFLAGDYAVVHALHAANGAAMIVVAAAFAMRRIRRATPTPAPPAPAAAPRPMKPVVQGTPVTPRPPMPPTPPMPPQR